MSEASGLNQGAGLNDGSGLGDYSLADELGLDPGGVAELEAHRYRPAASDRIGPGIVRHTDGRARSYRIDNSNQGEQVWWLLDNEGLFPPSSSGRR